ncbi:porin [Cupriavidus sp. UYPR2.512]|uniref:porin n=1 Tax=Cupriavidus sp. UYPR2.512 TaxID=1080187 RepID=UPI0003A364CF|nr:porin [Cupriavidus sp. UYPR2.512]UIF84737.1 porin [Cupriavidus necator]
MKTMSLRPKRGLRLNVLPTPKSRIRLLKSAGVVLVLCVPAGSALASVSLYGVLDSGLLFRTVAGVRNGQPASLFSTSSSTELTSRWGLVGVEDIGGGYQVGFKLESGFNVTKGVGNSALPFPQDTGALFDRGAVVGVDAPWGTIKLGRNWTPFFDGMQAADVTGYMNFASLGSAVFQNNSNVNPALGVAGLTTGANSPANGGLLYTWQNDSIKYMLPEIGPITGGVLYSFGGTAGSFSTKSAWSANLAYKSGNWGATVAYFDATDPTGQTSNHWLRAMTAGLNYQFGTVRLGVDFSKFRNPTTGANQNWYFLGASWQYSAPVRITANWLYLDDQVDKRSNGQLFKVGVAYSLSKRTTLYSDVGYSVNKSQGVLGGGPTTGTLPFSPVTIGRNQMAAAAGIRTLF